MSDMSSVITPKSDQANADDFLAGPRTIRITEVRITPGSEQPVSIHFEGDNGKPWKACKSMSRVLVAAWGADAKKYVGRYVTLYRDPSVKWAGEAVGGIRISHMSHIEKAFTMALTATRGSRKPYTVNVLDVAQSAPATAPPTVAEYAACNGAEYKLLEARRKEHYPHLTKQQNAELEAAKKAAFERLSAAAKPAPSAPPSTFDSAKSLEDLKRPSSREALEQTWSAVADHFDSLSAEIPLEYEAAYKLSKESFAE